MKALLLTTLLLVSAQSHAMLFKDKLLDSPKAYACYGSFQLKINQPNGGYYKTIYAHKCVIKYDKICLVNGDD